MLVDHMKKIVDNSSLVDEAHTHPEERGQSQPPLRRNSSRGGGASGPEFFKGGGGVRVQVCGNFHILTSKNNPPPRHPPLPA